MTKLLALIAFVAMTGCPIGSDAIGAFGAPCAKTCATGFTCDASTGVCVPATVGGGEGEGAEGEGAHGGEGEGAHGGEGEGSSSSEGEGSSSGEGEGSSGEGEGSSGDFCTDTGTACDCGVTRVCYAGQYCGPAFPACDQTDTCGLTDCTTDGTPEFIGCGSNGLCDGVAPHLVITMTWQGGGDIDMHIAKKDVQGKYCMDNFVDGTNFGGPAHSTVCGPGAPLDCWHNSCSAFNLAETFVNWGPTIDEIPSYATLLDAVGDTAGVVVAVNQLPAGDYVLGGYFRDTGQGNDPTTVTVTTQDLLQGTTVKNAFTFSIGTSQWKEFLHLHVDAENSVQCTANLLNSGETSACPP